MIKNQEKKDSKKFIVNAARYSGIGFQLLASIAVFTWIGYKADHAMNNGTPWLTALLSLAGVCIGLYVVIKQTAG